jgi:hypothetical protein
MSLTEGSRPAVLNDERRCSLENVLALEGPVLKVNGELMLFVALADEGSEFAQRSPAITEVQGEFVQILIPEWLAGLLDIEEGDLVRVQSDGRLHIHASGVLPVN